jgi:hypothetical protein
LASIEVPRVRKRDLSLVENLHVPAILFVAIRSKNPLQTGEEKSKGLFGCMGLIWRPSSRGIPRKPKADTVAEQGAST